MSTKSTTKEAVKETVSKVNKMYLGPTIVGVVRHSTVFKDGVYPIKVRTCIAQFPLMEKLFVSINDMPTAVKELNENQSVLKTIYNQTASKFNK